LEKWINLERVRFGNAFFEKENERWVVILIGGDRPSPLWSINPSTGKHWCASLDFLISWSVLPDPLMKLPEGCPKRHWKSFI
jgi:hypothetical protein